MKILLVIMLLISTSIFGIETNDDFDEERKNQKIEEENKQNLKTNKQNKNQLTKDQPQKYFLKKQNEKPKFMQEDEAEEVNN